MIPVKTESAWRGTADCRSCGIRDMVLFADLHEEDFKLIHAPIDDLEYPAGHALVRMGETATSLYTLRAGVVKLVRNTVDGASALCVCCARAT
jgi:CRP-like cAMP-binding protein